MKEYFIKNKNRYLLLSLILLVYIFFFLISFLFLSANDIYTWDEARHAVSAYEMIKNHNYLINTYMGSPDYWNLKPILAFWYLVPSYKIFGFTEFATRFPSVICGFITLTLIIIFVYRRLDIKYSILAGFSYICCLYVFFHFGCRTGNSDPIYVMFFTTSMICLLESQKHQYFYLGFFFFASLAFLTKSFHAFSILGIGLVYFLVVGDFKKLKVWIYPACIAVYCLLPLIWFVARYQFDGTKFFKGMIEDLFSRGTSAIEGHYGSIFYYFNLIKYSLPFWLCSILILFILIKGIYKKGIKEFIKVGFTKFRNNIFNDSNSDIKLLLCWSIIYFCGYSFVIQTKLPHYINAFYPSVALLVPFVVCYIQSKQSLKVNIKCLNGSKAIVGCVSISYAIALTVATPKIYINKESNDIKAILNTNEMKNNKGKNLYCKKTNSSVDSDYSWTQSQVFYIEINGFYPKNSKAKMSEDNHRNDRNSFYIFGLSEKDDYLIKHSDEKVILNYNNYVVVGYIE